MSRALGRRRVRRRAARRWCLPAAAALIASPAIAADDDGALARQLQDPLAGMHTLQIDADIAFGVGRDERAYAFSVQMVRSAALKDLGLTLIPRVTVPVRGVPGLTDLPALGEQRPRGSTEWGLGDIQSQFFFVKTGNANWRLGGGPAFSLKTRTTEATGGPGWGAGPVLILAGGFTEDLTAAFVLSNLWSFDGRFNTLLLEPNLYYNIASVPGLYVGYLGNVSADWKAAAGDRWTLPLGATIGRTLALGGGYGVDLSIGAYSYLARPDGGPDWSLKASFMLVFP